RMVSAYEFDEDAGMPVVPHSLDSYTLARSRRVRYEELVEFLTRNNTYERVNSVDPRQLRMF
ncbi:MAG: DNA-binding protein, partial [Candidatus Marinimicrobia bacterium]|nr:DNA-binding protein [Candidatus Neomarinimicrobiota bacterium]